MLQTQLDEADSRSKTLQREVYSPTKVINQVSSTLESHCGLLSRLKILLLSHLTVALCLPLLSFTHLQLINRNCSLVTTTAVHIIAYIKAKGVLLKAKDNTQFCK